MVEIYTDPTQFDELADTILHFAPALTFALVGSLLIGLLAWGVSWGSRDYDGPGLMKRDPLIAAATAAVALTGGLFWVAGQPSSAEVSEAREQRDQVIAENEESTEEQFTERYGELEFLSCDDGSCQPVEGGLFEVIDGDHGTDDVAFRDEQGVLHEDAYLSREASSDPDVAATVKLMLRDDGHEAEEYDPEPSDEEAQ